MREITKVTLELVDGFIFTVDREGNVITFRDTEDSVEEVAEDFPSICGIWFGTHECTIPWDEVIDFQNTDFHLTSDMYVDNGQVVDEGRIVKMIVEFNEGMSDTWVPNDEERIEDVAQAFMEEYEGIGVAGEHMTAFGNIALRLCEQIEDAYDLGVAMERLYKALREVD